MTDRVEDDFAALELPELGDRGESDEEGMENEGDAGVDIAVVDDGGDPFDDSYADDIPLDVQIQTLHEEPSAIGDDAVGLGKALGDDGGIQIEDAGVSMIDEGRGHAEEGLDFVGDDELGIDPIPTEMDDGGVEGLDDEGGEPVDADDFPPLDGADDDDDAEELDLGLDLAPPPESEHDPDPGDD